jgi:Protein of unknown function (DUF3052)
MATNAAKLGLRVGGRLTVRGLSTTEAASVIREVIGDLPDGARLDGESPGEADVLVLFAGDVEQVHAEVLAARELVGDGGRLWVAYRKGAGPAALNRDTLQRALAAHGLVGVTLVSLDAAWSAMRVRDLRPGESAPAT